MQDDPTPDDISELVDSIDESTLPWSVTDWNHETGRYADATLSLELEWSALDALGDDERRDLNHVIHDVIDTLEQQHDEGAPIDTIVDTVVDNQDGVEREQVEQSLEHLRLKGEVYEPRSGHLRRT